MSVFTLSQTRDTITTRYEVDADGSVATQLSPYPASNANYLCVNNASENSYVYNSTPSLLLDLYSIVTTDLPADDINWIKITVNAKSQDSRPASDATYKIIHSIDGGATIEESTNIDLITAYNNYYWVLWDNPSTSSPWTYAELCDLEIGVECSSPTREIANATQILIPDGDGWIEQLQRNSGNDTDNWDVVDTLHSGSSYLKNTTQGALEDGYSISAFSEDVEVTIKSISVHYYAYNYYLNPYPEWVYDCKPSLRCNGIGTTHYGVAVTPIAEGPYYSSGGGMGHHYSHTWTTNPNTGIAWTEADLATLQIGMWLEGCQGFNKTWLVFTHINCVVTYSKLGNPSLKTNHIYLDVNADEDDSICTLTSPTDIETHHSRDSNAINFWNGDREVYDICRSGKGITVSGDEYEGDEEHSSTPCERITCIRDMGRDGNLVEISGLGTLYDGTYRIKSFGWNKISEQPEYYTWQLELEVED